MASRRPTTRLKPAANPLVQVPNRQRPTAKESTHAPNALNSTAPVTLSRNSENAGSNIQVIIRCRNRSDREVQENSPIIVACNGAKSKAITIEGNTPQSSLGVVTLPPLRTYPFDLVFGPEADQAMIYHDVVSPMLEEVMAGYNCTLFAYGQTGTGKTYTMNGDLNPTPMGNPSPDAGMIPRTLFRLFHSLETSKADYSVKISFIEIYNEELRDLLANELPPPSGSTQPMGSGAKDKATEGLKIFDEASKRGVFIQGLEEIAVRDRKHALALLTKGSERRQIAATHFNDHSSRSHSIFSIIVHIKETSNLGDDLLKVGKLNLVDLAGSENIGRSGAENKRAREAGMINQSLLTLGRVINALVDKAQHVPYRESKLTRLLQDSLGGRTKTCIIATISPARVNIEETLSTLDYALRAKSIRNKPEVNQRMTRNGLLKEYIAEIERLKTDLLVAREKSGIYVTQEYLDRIDKEQELHQTELQEAQKQIELVESRMRAVREEFEQTIGLLMKRDEELEETKGQLESTKETLSHTESRLQETRNMLDEEIIVRSAHQDTESNLNLVAKNLKDVATESLRDIGGLFEKLHRTSGILKSNIGVVSTCESTIASLTEAVSEKLDDLHKSTTDATIKLQSLAKEAATTNIDKLSAYSKMISEQLVCIRSTLDTIQEKNEVEDVALQAVQTSLSEMQNTLKHQFISWSTNLTSTSSVICEDLQETNHKGMTTVEEALGAVHSALDSILTGIQQYIKDVLSTLEQSQRLANDSAQSEITHLRQQNEHLIQILKEEKIKADLAKEMLMHRMSELLDVFMNEQYSRMEVNMNGVRDHNLRAEKAWGSYLQQQTALIGGISESGHSLRTTLQSQGESTKRTRDGAFKALSQTRSTMKEKTQALHHELSSSIASHTTWTIEQTTQHGVSASDAFEQYRGAKRARLDTIDALGNDIKSFNGRLGDELMTSSEHLGIAFNGITTQASSLLESSSDYNGSLSNDLDSLRSANRRLIEHGTRPDMSTGSTPRKKTWDYIDHWDLTENRAELLRRKANEKGPAPTGNETRSTRMSSSLISQTEDAHVLEGEVPIGINSLEALSNSDQVGSPAPSISSRSSSSQDSPATQASSVELGTRNKIMEPVRPAKKPRVSSAVGIPPRSRPAPLVESRLQNIASRRSQRFAR